ncbi:MAG: AAA family ATPase [Betaproteobacteria bacterium]|nr:AAA family ATPase [Betaproteobacteria bacterium]
MSITFRRAIRENIGLIIGLAGPSGGGKTLSAMRLAKGLCAGKPFAFIDTENGRGKHYADSFEFDHADLSAPFRPSSYADAIKAADAAHYPVIVVDSCSHEHAGEGGLLDWHEEELDRMAGDDWKRRDACKMAAWIKPKMDHKQFVSRLLQVRAHLILCFRAEQKVEMKKIDGRMEIVPKTVASGFSDWIPICEKNMLYELTASFLLTPEAPGVPKPIKLPGAVRPFISLKDPLNEQVGKDLAEWASGTKSAAPPGAKTERHEQVERGDALAHDTSKPAREAASTGPTMTAANACQQFRLSESVAEAAQLMNQWMAEAHSAEDRQRVNAAFAEAKQRLARRK